MYLLWLFYLNRNRKSIDQSYKWYFRDTFNISDRGCQNTIGSKEQQEKSTKCLNVFEKLNVWAAKLYFSYHFLMLLCESHVSIFIIAVFRTRLYVPFKKRKGLGFNFCSICQSKIFYHCFLVAISPVGRKPLQGHSHQHLDISWGRQQMVWHWASVASVCSESWVSTRHLSCFLDFSFVLTCLSPGFLTKTKTNKTQ